VRRTGRARGSEEWDVHGVEAVPFNGDVDADGFDDLHALCVAESVLLSLPYAGLPSHAAERLLTRLTRELHFFKKPARRAKQQAD